jgi:hypothetical protein
MIDPHLSLETLAFVAQFRSDVIQIQANHNDIWSRILILPSAISCKINHRIYVAMAQ